MTETLDGLCHGEYDYTAQESEKATLCGKIEKEDGKVAPTRDTLMFLYNKYRAYYLWPKIYFLMTHRQTQESKRVIIESLQIDESLYLLHKDESLFDDTFTLNPAVLSCLVKVEGKKTISWADRVQTYGREHIIQ